MSTPVLLLLRAVDCAGGGSSGSVATVEAASDATPTVNLVAAVSAGVVAGERERERERERKRQTDRQRERERHERETDRERDGET